MVIDLEMEKLLAAQEAVKLISSNQIVGLGSGSTASYAIKELSVLIQNGLKIKAVPTSNKSKALAESLNIPLIDINSISSIDITIDGADEFNADLVLIKGGGGALLREKIVASLTRREIIIVDSSKKVDLLGKFKLPVEVIPFASQYVLNKIQLINAIGKIRFNEGKPFITDGGNYIIDVDFGYITNPIYLSDRLNNIEGIVCHGLFIKLANTVIMGLGKKTLMFEAD